jgi:uncharacterized protein YjiS (DUF1127 family)
MTTAVLGGRRSWQGPEIVGARIASRIRRRLAELRAALLAGVRRWQAIDRAEAELSLMNAHMRRDIGLDPAPRARMPQPELGWL